jgi:hypothetical protein
MKKFLVLVSVALSSILMSSCGDDCDPGQLPTDDKLVLNMVNANGTAFLKYASDALPDSVKVTNLTTNTLVSRYLIADSILIIEDYTKTAGAVTRLKIAKGNFIKPDTIELTVSRQNAQDNCLRDFEVARFLTVKANNVVKCSNCAANTAIYIQR